MNKFLSYKTTLALLAALLVLVAFFGSARADQLEEWPSDDLQLTLFPVDELAPTNNVTLASYCDDVLQPPPCGDLCCGEDVCSQEIEFAQTLSKMVSVWSKFDISGHVRVRQATDFERIGRSTRNRQRLRARLALTYTANEEIRGGVRWTTGDRKLTLEPGDRRGSPLSYQDAGDVFDKFEFNLDRIFIRYDPHWLPHAWFVGGKFKHQVKLNPIYASPVGSLVWDEAAHPEGIAAGYAWNDWLGIDAWRLVATESAVLELSNSDDSSLFNMQVWLEKTLGPTLKVEAGVAWYDWHNLNPDDNRQISSENNAGNAVISLPVDSAGRTDVFASRFSIINPMLVVTYGNSEGSRLTHPIQFVGEAFHNTKSFDSGRDTGFSVGGQYGPALKSQRKKKGWKIYYTWNEVEQESVFTPVAQDDFQRATNFRGHWLGLDYFPWDNVESRLWLLSDKPILPINGSREEEWRARFDLTVYF